MTWVGWQSLVWTPLSKVEVMIRYTSMTIVVLFIFLFGSVWEATGQPRFTTPVPSPNIEAEIFIDQNLIVRELNPRPIGGYYSFDTPSGRVFLAFNDVESLVQIYFDDMPSISLSYPKEFLGDGDDLAVIYVREQGMFAFCTTGGLFSIDTVAPAKFELIDPTDCHPRIDRAEWQYGISLSPGGRFFAYFPADSRASGVRETRFYDMETRKVVSISLVAGEVGSWMPRWSPNWEHSVEMVNSGAYGSTLVVKHQGTDQIDSTIYIGWEGIEVEGWLDDDHLILRGYAPYTTSSMVDELFLVSMLSGTTVSLGKHISRSVLFFDNFSKLARIQPRDNAPIDPYFCMLNILDMTTLTSKDVETTFCRQPSDLTMLKKSHSLLYLHSDMPSNEASLQSVPVLHLVNLDNLTVEELPLNAVNWIASLSSDEKYLMLLVDDPHSSRRNLYYWLEWKDPRAVIIDLQQKHVLHEQRILPGNVISIRWSSQNNMFVLSTGTESNTYISLITLDPLQETPLPDALERTFLWREHVYLKRYSQWSPKDNLLLVFTNYEAQIIRPANHEIVPIARLQETDTFALDIEWYGNSSLLLVEAIPAQGNFTLGRWIVNPLLALPK